MKKLIIITAFLTSFIYVKAQSWLAVGSGMSTYSTVLSLGVYNGDLIAGGWFDTAGGHTANDIAAWNGTSWSAIGTGMNGQVNAIAVYGGNLVAGGDFSTAGGNAASNIAVWNGTAWAALGTGTNGSVSSLVVYQGNLIAAGSFTTAGGNAANYIAVWNGTAWAALGSGLNGTVNALDTADNLLYVGGYFSTAGGNAASNIASWNGTAWATLGSGMNNSVYSLTIYGGKLVAGGYFTTAGGNAANYIASWSGTTWSAIGSGLPGIVTNLAAINNTLYAVPNYVSTNAQKWNGTSWSVIPGVLDSVYALGVYRGNLYAGGGFRFIGSTQVNYVAELMDSNSSAGINTISSLNAEAAIFPNPNNGAFTIELKSAQLPIKNTVEVYNMLGEKIFTGNLNSANTQIKLSNAGEGMYLYRIISENGNLVSQGKLIIQ